MSVIEDPLPTEARHVEPQLIPAGELVTVPVPLPDFMTNNAKVAGGEGGETVTVTVVEAVELPPGPMQVRV